jgi:hypothetical protein
MLKCRPLWASLSGGRRRCPKLRRRWLAPELSYWLLTCIRKNMDLGRKKFTSLSNLIFRNLRRQAVTYLKDKVTSKKSDEKSHVDFRFFLKLWKIVKILVPSLCKFCKLQQF